jgi:hypothetical protein
VGNLFEACHTLTFIGTALLDLKRLDEAEAFARAVVEARKRFNTTAFLTSAQSLLVDVLLEQGRFDEATPIIEEALARARARPPTFLTGFDPVRRLVILSVRTRVGQGLLDAAGAAAELEALLPGAGGREMAAIVYWRWEITGSEEHRLAAAATLREAYAAQGLGEVRTRYYELTGEWLPAPSLPDVSSLIPTAPDLDALIAGVKALLPELTTSA